MCVFSLKFLSQNYNTLKGETHRHEKAVPCQRGFLAITARVVGVVQHKSISQSTAAAHDSANLNTKTYKQQLIHYKHTSLKKNP